jgi:hypothetical protein
MTEGSRIIYRMELHEQTTRPTLAQKVGDVTHFSPLLRKVRELSGCSLDDLPEWLLKCAVERGASHYRRKFDPDLPTDNPALTNEELGAALCLAHLPFNPIFIRAAAQLLSDKRTDPEVLIRIATMERCEPILLHISHAAEKVAPREEPWISLRRSLFTRHHVRTDSLPHWSRFVLQSGFTPAGKGTHIQWLTCNE